jgi:hypothetical protein
MYDRGRWRPGDIIELTHKPDPGPWHKVAVSVHCDFNAMMAKLGLDIGDADTLRQEERGIGVAQIRRFTVGQAAGHHHGTPDLCSSPLTSRNTACWRWCLRWWDMKRVDGFSPSRGTGTLNFQFNRSNIDIIF